MPKNPSYGVRFVNGPFDGRVIYRRFRRGVDPRPYFVFDKWRKEYGYRYSEGVVSSISDKFYYVLADTPLMKEPDQVFRYCFSPNFKPT